jgi:hypothetical protein
VSAVAWATHHIKNWMFSNTVVNSRTRTYSTWVTSYNLTRTSDAQFNDVFVVNDNFELYAASVKSFVHFYRQRRTDNFYAVPGRGHHVIPNANTEISYSPQKPTAHLPPNDIAHDYEAKAHSRIDGHEPGCTLQVAMLSISSSRRKYFAEIWKRSKSF